MKTALYCFLLLLSISTFAEVNSESFTSKALNTQVTFKVSVPTSYGTRLNQSYPVIYVLHGQWDFTLVQSISDTLKNEIPEFIIVQVIGKGEQLQPNDANITENARLFRQHFTSELIPYIKNNYRTANYSILIGHSNAGRFAMEQFLTKSPLFNDYFIFSPSLDDGYIVSLAQSVTELKAHLFLSIANEGEHMQQPFNSLITMLVKHPSLSLTNEKYAQYSHQSSKVIALVNAFQTRFSHWQANYETKIAGLAPLLAHYSALQKEFGFQVLPSKDDLIRLLAYFAINNNGQEVTKIHDYLIAHYSTAAESITEIEQYLEKEGYQSAAKLINSSRLQ
ncbi:alpha/beta hydrolase [Pseudoalteromonas spongiae]|uniref:alpha/beta hydrolase n=1 Tax=Pseudoalteromonas spongiae TaxID=298657 RepID=UPI000C2CEF6C|nr:alpha/beta hydrolase-fold protein [Pseudoalteromonas spongiae]